MRTQRWEVKPWRMGNLVPAKPDSGDQYLGYVGLHRDEFALAALSHPLVENAATFQTVAKRAYALADAMLEVRREFSE